MSRPRNNHFPQELRKYSKKTLHAVRVYFDLESPMLVTESMIIQAGRIGIATINYTDQYKKGI